VLSPILTLDSSKVRDDLVFLMGCLRDVLEESGEQALAERLPWVGAAPADVDGTTSPERLSQAYSIAFRLFSMVEQNAAVQQQRQTEAEHGLTAMQALWGQCLQQLVDRGITPEQIAAALPGMRVDLVLTA
jgi:phosphoenolpyruvate carboxylase